MRPVALLLRAARGLFGTLGGSLLFAALAQGSELPAAGEASALLGGLGSALLREDRNFHTIQMIEAAFRQWSDTGDSIFLVAAARYLAAHAPTVRAQEQTFTIASRLHRGERLYEEP